MQESTQLLQTLDYDKPSHGLRLWRAPNSPLALNDPAMLEAIRKSGSPGRLDATVFKNGTRNSVFQIYICSASFIVKAFPLNTLKHKLKYKKYGLAEICHNHRAKQLGIPVPTCFAYFEMRPWGLVDNCGVVMQELSGYVALADICQNDKSLYTRAIPALLKLYETGANHIDPSPHNIFMHGQTGEFAIIDWQYCSFHPPRDDRQLVIHGAHFLRYADIFKGDDLWRSWLGELHQKSLSQMPLNVFLENVAQIQYKQQNRMLSTHDRLRLNLDLTGVS